MSDVMTPVSRPGGNPRAQERAISENRFSGRRGQRMVPRLLLCCLLAVSAGTLPYSAAWAQMDSGLIRQFEGWPENEEYAKAQHSDPASFARVALWSGGAVVLLIIGLGVFSWRVRSDVRLLVKTWITTHPRDTGGTSATAADHKDPLSAYLALPFGLPEGTVRAFLALCILFFACILLISQKVLGDDTATAFTTLLSSLAGFYFGSRIGTAGVDSANQRAAEAEKRSASTAVQLNRQKTETELKAKEVERLKAEVQKTETDIAKKIVAETTSAVGSRETLLEDRGRLEQIKALAPILAFVLPKEYYGSVVAPALTIADRALNRIEPMIEGQAVDTVQIATAVAEIAGDVAEVSGENHPLAIILGTAMRSFAKVASTTSAVGGFAAGPAGIALGLFTGAVAAFKEGAEAYERWIAYVLALPYVLRLSPGSSVTLPVAQEALRGAPIFLRAFGREAPAAQVTALMTLALHHETDAQLAARVETDPALLPGLGSLNSRFEDADEFAAGMAEYRQSLLSLTIISELPDDKLPLTDSERRSAPRMRDLLPTIALLREDRAAAKDLDILGRLAKALMKESTTAPLDVLGLIRSVLTDAEKIAARQPEDTVVRP